jgi:hypothetical protein
MNDILPQTQPLPYTPSRRRPTTERSHKALPVRKAASTLVMRRSEQTLEIPAPFFPPLVRHPVSGAEHSAGRSAEYSAAEERENDADSRIKIPIFKLVVVVVQFVCTLLLWGFGAWWLRLDEEKIESRTRDKSCKE